MLISRHICLVKDLGIQGNLFGGIMLSWLDEAAAIYVSDLIESPRNVTAVFNKVVFDKPVKEGNIINIYGEVEKVGKTSITVIITAKRQNVETREEVQVCSTSAVFVKIDADGTPRLISEEVKIKIENGITNTTTT